MSAAWGSTKPIEDLKLARRMFLIWGMLAAWGLSVLFATIRLR